MLSFAVALFALSATSPVAGVPPEDTTRPAEAESAITLSARHWLALVDASNWKQSWLVTAMSFRAVNTVERWASASQTARVPLGAVLSRVLIGEDDVPTPPNGNMVVKFRTRFTAKADAVETVALVREGANWRVVGYYIN